MRSLHAEHAKGGGLNLAIQGLRMAVSNKGSDGVLKKGGQSTALSPSPRTVRVSAGSITPSSHRRALGKVSTETAGIVHGAPRRNRAPEIGEDSYAGHTQYLAK